MNDFPFFAKAIIGLNLLEMIDWVHDSIQAVDRSFHQQDKPPIALPPVQRSAVWRPQQVVDLWDSLFRGLPIGMFYLVKRDEGEKDRFDSWKGEIRRVESAGYDLLDGQQRVRALLVGAVGIGEEKRCLWIDLNDKDNLPHPILRINSKTQPFGYDPKTGNKFSLEQRRTARARLEKNGEIKCCEATGIMRPAFDRELFEDDVFQDGKRIRQPPFPHGASDFTFELSRLLKAWREAMPKDTEEGIAALESVARNIPRRDPLIRLHQAFEKIRYSEVALLCVDPKALSESKGDLLKLFDRIGAGGTPLSVEERLYSIYKYHWPHILNAVNQIHLQVGRVLPPTKIAVTAIRIAYAASENNRNESPNVANFSKILTEEKFRADLSRLIPEESSRVAGRSTLLSSFETIKSLLWYGKDIGHFWIPEVMLALLPAELWQVLAYWAWTHNKHEISALSRQEAVRLSLFWHLAVQNNEKAARWAFEYIKNNANVPEFPGAALYKRFTGDGDDHCARELIPPDEFVRRLCKQEDPKWRTDAERFLLDNGSRNEIGFHWWWYGVKMLPWLQKDYVHRAFPDYVPLTDHEDDLPYDIDHLCPAKDWREDWRTFKNRLDINDPDLIKRVDQYRGAVGNGIGNLQLLDSSLNRGSQDDDVATKMSFIQRHDRQPTKDDEQAMADFAFAPEHRELWGRVSCLGKKVGDRRWNEDRLKAFQRAVELRAAWLYRRFHDDLGYENWTREK